MVLGTQHLALQADEHARATLAHAVQCGVAWLDVADVYGEAPGDAERLLAPVAHEVRVATKGGLVRRGPRWIPDGRQRHLLHAAEASRHRLGVDRIALYFLHVPDPRVPIQTSAKALAKLQQQGVIERVGLSNIGVHQLRQAQEWVQVDCVQIPFGPLDPSALRSGIVEVCLAEGIDVWGYRPFGGGSKSARITRHDTLAAVAADDGSPQRVVLKWLLDLGIWPVPGPTRPSTVADCLQAERAPLHPEALAKLDHAFPRHAWLRAPRSSRAPDPQADGEVRIVMGSPGSGKTTRAQAWVEAGYERLNRDERGGTLRKLLRPLGELLASGTRTVVLDNTYPTRASRNDVIEAAWAHGVPVTCEWVRTEEADCERNVVERMLDQLGTLPEPDDIARLAKKGTGVIPPRALYRYRATEEPPQTDEGLAAVVEVPFERDPATGRAALLVDPGHLDELAQSPPPKGLPILVIGWDPERPRTTAEQAVKARLADLDLEVHVAICPHPAGPPVCWCRKPLVGLAVWLARSHGLDLTRSVVLATSPADRTLARKLGALHVAGASAAYAALQGSGGSAM